MIGVETNMLDAPNNQTAKAMPLPTPKPPTADGNPPEYNAMKDLAERCAKAEAELERVQKQRDTMQDRLIRMQCNAGSDVVPRSELEASQKREAAYLNELRFWAGGKHKGDCEFIAPDEGCWKCEKAEQDRWPQTKAVLDQPDPGSDFVRRSELDRVKIERDEALVARDFADAALERVQKREAAMREALGFALECANELLEYNGENFQFNMRGKIWSLKTRSGAALQPDAGSDTL